MDEFASKRKVATDSRAIAGRCSGTKVLAFALFLQLLLLASVFGWDSSGSDKTGHKTITEDAIAAVGADYQDIFKGSLRTQIVSGTYVQGWWPFEDQHKNDGAQETTTEYWGIDADGTAGKYADFWIEGDKDAGKAYGMARYLKSKGCGSELTEAYKDFGRGIHLIQDARVPAHVRYCPHGHFGGVQGHYDGLESNTTANWDYSAGGPTVALTGGGGSGAKATATVTNGVVTAVTVTNGGKNYATAPAVSFRGGAGAGATATAAIAGGPISEITVTNGGTGYTTSPSVSITDGGGTGATATATLGGSVSSIDVTNGGTGYKTPPWVHLEGGGGSGAEATATGPGGSVTTIVVDEGGTGYTTAPDVEIWGGNVGEEHATATATIENGAVTAITVTDGSTGYWTTPFVSITGGGGNGATATATITGGPVTGITVTKGGTGYTTAPTVTLWGGDGTGATATATVPGDVVTDITVTNGGTGYTSPPAVTLTGGGGTGATATASAGGVVSSITVTDGGANYSTAPTAWTFILAAVTYTYWLNDANDDDDGANGIVDANDGTADDRGNDNRPWYDFSEISEDYCHVANSDWGTYGYVAGDAIPGESNCTNGGDQFDEQLLSGDDANKGNAINILQERLYLSRKDTEDRLKDISKKLPPLVTDIDFTCPNNTFENEEGKTRIDFTLWDNRKNAADCIVKVTITVGGHVIKDKAGHIWNEREVTLPANSTENELPFKAVINDLEWDGKTSDNTYLAAGNYDILITVKDAEATPNETDSDKSDTADEKSVTIVDNQ